MTGVNIKVRVGALVLRCSKVTTEGSATDQDVSDGESGGYAERTSGGLVERTVTFEGWRRDTDGAPPLENEVLPNVLIAWDGNVAVPTVNKREYYSSLVIMTATRTGEVRGGSQAYTLVTKSSGPYYPEGVPGP